MARLSPYTIASAFDTFSNTLDSMKLSINNGMPTTIPEAGRLKGRFKIMHIYFFVINEIIRCIFPF